MGVATLDMRLHYTAALGYGRRVARRAPALPHVDLSHIIDIPFSMIISRGYFKSLTTCLCPCITSGEIADIVSEGRTCKTNKYDGQKILSDKAMLLLYSRSRHLRFKKQ
ncbi:hypothetical protein RND71_023456 [Anisodus tanguticus]|uniref:Uncharacterized protein n=1 Tax=Anisodus tanguticus TaxID=243964 RepID=A0AAE1RVM6_9SOLA|nr:hypothetical protein RND71_023456 [Anisodus tanguticus]